MPRPPRLHVPGGHYHVILRGNHREPLFDSPADREALGDIVAKAIERFDARVHAFCWMTNHLHLLMQIDQRPLGKPMQRIAMRFTRAIGTRRCARQAIFSSGATRPSSSMSTPTSSLSFVISISIL